MINGVYGVNIAVSDFQNAVQKFQEVFGIQPIYLGEEDFSFPDLIGARFPVGGFVFTVIGSKTDTTSVAKFVEKYGDGVFLVSLMVDNIEKDVEDLKNKGLNFVTEIKDSPLGKVSFVHPKSFHGVQLEIVQIKQET